MRMGFSLGLVICALASVAALAADGQHKKKANSGFSNGMGYGMAGCGLGSMAFGDQPGAIQIIAATTNNIVFPQTFAISSGTSNCDPAGSASNRASAFIFANRESLEKDIARGNGETISSLSQIMGCSDSVVVGGKLQKSFTSIFPNQEVGTDQVVNSILKTVRSDNQLSKSCPAIVG